jgi:hypothetical protein
MNLNELIEKCDAADAQEAPRFPIVIKGICAGIDKCQIAPGLFGQFLAHEGNCTIVMVDAGEVRAWVSAVQKSLQRSR